MDTYHAPTLCIKISPKSSQRKHHLEQAVIYASKLTGMSVDFNQIKGDNEMLKSFPFICTRIGKHLKLVFGL